jgi:hypothetical protein
MTPRGGRNKKGIDQSWRGTKRPVRPIYAHGVRRVAHRGGSRSHLIVHCWQKSFAAMSESYCTVFLLLSSRMHNLNLALREVSTAGYDERQTHLR